MGARLLKTIALGILAVLFVYTAACWDEPHECYHWPIPVMQCLFCR